MEYVIELLESKRKDFAHYERLALIKGNKITAKGYRYKLLQFEKAISILSSEKKTETQNDS